MTLKEDTRKRHHMNTLEEFNITAQEKNTLKQ